MSDVKRLLDEGSSFERQLLQSSDSDEPSPALERKILAALVPMASTADAAESSHARGGPHASSAFRLVRPAAIATIAIGLVVGGSLLVNTTPTPPAAGPSVSEPAAPAAPAVVPEEPTAAPADVPAVTPDSLPTAPPAEVAVQPPAQAGGRPRTFATSTPSSQNAKMDLGSSLEREIALLDSVKTKLGAGAAADAAHALDAYDAEFPQGTLRPEATVLRIRTLLLQGKRPEAQKLADDFLAKHPGSVHAKRIRALLAN